MDNKKPKCKLVGTDGNVFAVIGAVSSALKKNGQAAKAKEFQVAAMSSDSYDDVLALCFKYVDVQ